MLALQKFSILKKFNKILHVAFVVIRYGKMKNAIVKNAFIFLHKKIIEIKTLP